MSEVDILRSGWHAIEIIRSVSLHVLLGWHHLQIDLQNTP
jgi:hypothetical protein